MTNRLSVPISSLWLALSVIACSSQPSSSKQEGQGGAIGTSSGGTLAHNTGGTATSNTDKSSASGGKSADNAGGNASTASAAGGTTTSGTSASGGADNTGGKSGTAAGGTTTSSGGADNTGGKSSSATSAAGGTGGKSSAAGGTSAGNTGGNSATSGGSSAGNSGGKASGGSGTNGGGSAAGGGDMGGGPATPQLITSAQNDYFNTTHQATIVTSGTADLTVDETTQYQRWDGFGGTFNEMGWDALNALTAAENSNALTLLFDPNNGANFVFGRIPMGASDYSTSWYTLDDASSADYSMNNFSITRDKQKLIPFIKAALQIRSDIRLWASPWVVPSWMMDGSSNMKSDAQTLTAHALYMAKFVEEYAKQEALTIWAIHPQNEPGYARVHWKQADLINFMKTYLGPTFEQRNLTTEIWCGTMSKDPDDTNIALAAAKDEDAMKYIKGFGVQWNPLPGVPALAAKATVMQTEHRCGNYNGFDTDYTKASQYNSSKPPNDHAYGEESWQLIRDWIFAGVNSYSAWNMVLDTNGKSLDGWPQNALLVVDTAAKKLIQTPAYYVFRQFSQFILPGATRIAATSSSAALKGISTQTWNGLNALAFKNANGSIVTEIYNKGASAQTLIVKVGSTMYQISVPAHGWDTLNVKP